jgi:hypothetical protein
MSKKEQTEEVLIKQQKEKLLKEVSDWLDYAVLDEYRVENVKLCCKKDHTTITVDGYNNVLVLKKDEVLVKPYGYSQYSYRECPYFRNYNGCCYHS